MHKTTKLFKTLLRRRFYLQQRIFINYNMTLIIGHNKGKQKLPFISMLIHVLQRFSIQQGKELIQIRKDNNFCPSVFDHVILGIVFCQRNIAASTGCN